MCEKKVEMNIYKFMIIAIIVIQYVYGSSVLLWHVQYLPSIHFKNICKHNDCETKCERSSSF